MIKFIRGKTIWKLNQLIHAMGVTPTFKSAMDSYEEFFNEYAEFMKKYAESDDSLSMIADYTKYM